jgi:hypothetical protein
MDVHYDPYEECTPTGRLAHAQDLQHGLALFRDHAPPAWVAEIDRAKAEIISLNDGNDPQKYGKMTGRMVSALFAIDKAPHILGRANEQFRKRFAKSMHPGRRGISYEVISRPPYLSSDENMCIRGGSVEYIFDAWSREYLEFLDIVARNAPTTRQVGYVALNWSPRSRATLGMHSIDNGMGVAVEVSSIHGLPDNEAWFAQLEGWAIARGGRPHWGQINGLFPSTVAMLYGPERVASWRERLGALTGNSMTFSNDYTFQRGLEPFPNVTNPTLFGRRVGDIGKTAVLAPAINLLLGN